VDPKRASLVGDGCRLDDRHQDDAAAAAAAPQILVVADARVLDAIVVPAETEPELDGSGPVVQARADGVADREAARVSVRGLALGLGRAVARAAARALGAGREAED